MISWKVTQLNKIHPCTPEKERGRVNGGGGEVKGRGWRREGGHTQHLIIAHNNERKTHLHKSCLLKNRLTSASANTATGQYPA